MTTSVPDPMFVTDTELVERMNLPESLAWALIRDFDAKQPTFPKKQKLFGDRRYLPAVKAWFDARNGLKMGASEPTRRERYVR